MIEIYEWGGMTVDVMIKKERDNIFRLLCIGVVVIFGVFLILLSMKSKILMRGDGVEYALQVEAWLNHRSMDIREEDFFSTAYFYGGDIAQGAKERLQIDGEYKYIALNGNRYAPHFGGYSALVSQINLLFKVCRLDPANSFALVNGLLYFAAIMTVFWGARMAYEKKIYLLLLLIINPAVFYLVWPHPEVYSFAFTIMGLVFFYRKQHKISIFLISMAAMQNIGLMFLGMAIGLDYWKKIIRNFFRSENNNKILFVDTVKLFVKYIIDILIAGICYMPGLLPVIHTWVNFKKINLVATVAMENQYLLEKVWAYWTDLNLGIMPYMPLVVVIFFLQMILLLGKKPWDVFLHVLAVGGIYYVLSHQIQINSDMDAMMRYNVWVVPILLFFVVYNGDVFSWAVWFKRGIGISLVMTVLVMNLSNGLKFGIINVFGSLEFAPWTTAVLKYAPDLYQPYHGIFISRTLNYEQYRTSDPIVYSDSQGNARKLLIPRSQIRGLVIEGTHEDKEWLTNKFGELKDKEYQYISIPYNKQIKVLKALDEFNPEIMNQSNNMYLVKGIHANEGSFCWTEPSVELKMNPKAFKERDFVVVYMLDPIVVDTVDGKKTSIELYINDELITRVDVDTIPVGQYQKLSIKSSDLPAIDNDFWNIKLRTNLCFNPHESGFGDDNRNLSLRLQHIGSE